MKQQIDVLALKKRGFGRILDVEEKNLTHSKALIAALRQRIEADRGVGCASARRLDHLASSKSRSAATGFIAARGAS